MQKRRNSSVLAMELDIRLSLALSLVQQIFQ